MARPPNEARQLGSFVQVNSSKLIVGVSLALLALCAALKSAKFDSKLNSWIQKTARVEAELAAVQSVIGEGAGSNSLLLLQAPASYQINTATSKNLSSNIQTNILTVEAFMVHLEALAIATHVSVDLFDVSWSLKDLCFAPTAPDYEGLHVGLMLDNLMPCATKTPLDCFWEGSKILGPDPVVNLGAWGPKLRWTNLDPIQMVQARQEAHPHASFPYAALLDWMQRVGITSGYQRKPCLDPNDPNCPNTAPNKITGVQPDIGAYLTGGCRGVASKQMHWREEEIVGGVVKNKTGHITGAGALQSIIQLMGEQDMYDYWRKTSKVQDVNNWSVDKAKVVIEAWQRRLKEELTQFSQKAPISSSYKIYAMTPESMLEPIDAHSMLDLTNFEICILLMTLYMIIAFPNFKIHTSTATTEERFDTLVVPIDKIETISRLKIVLLATLMAAYIGLTFIASLGVSSFLNLPFNMATTQILPPLALYYGFKQSLGVAYVYSRNFNLINFESLTFMCLNEALPAIILESVLFIVPFLVSTMIPVEATRVFALQVITYITLATISTIILVPSLLTTFLTQQCPQLLDESFRTFDSKTTHIEQKYSSKSTRSSIKFNRLEKKTDSAKSHSKFNNNAVIDDQIFSRLQDDLKNVKVDSPTPSNLDISTRIKSDGSLHTSIRMTAAQSLNQSKESFKMPPRKEIISTPVEYQPNHSDANCSLPDFLCDIIPPNNVDKSVEALTLKQSTHQYDEKAPNNTDQEGSPMAIEPQCKLVDKYIKCSILNCIAQVIIFMSKLGLIVAIIMQIHSVKYGLQIQDIVARSTQEYESFKIQEKFFPVYNIFAITKGNFDYPGNQQLLHEFYKRIEQVEGIIRDEDTDRPKFWLVYFRDWLLELQEEFDVARNKSLINREGWTQDASDAVKLAYKLLAQTGRPDNPIDKSLVESNRLVDSTGLINPKAFYYYLTAWVVNDAFSYSNSEANFRPEPKVWNDNPDDLRIERARPIMYAQIPFLLKLPAVGDGVRVISELRSISNAFEQLNMPNFPTGIPFIFWDQFLSLNLTFFITALISIVSLYLIIGLSLSDFKAAAIVALPVSITLIEVYGLMGYMRIPFNNVFAVLLIGMIGFMASQSLHYVTVSRVAYILGKFLTTYRSLIIFLLYLSSLLTLILVPTKE